MSFSNELSYFFMMLGIFKAINSLDSRLVKCQRQLLEIARGKTKLFQTQLLSRARKMNRVIVEVRSGRIMQKFT